MLNDMYDVESIFDNVEDTLLNIHKRLEGELYNIAAAEAEACCTYIDDDPQIMDKLKAYGAAYEILMDMMEGVLTEAQWFGAAWKHTLK